MPLPMPSLAEPMVALTISAGLLASTKEPPEALASAARLTPRSALPMFRLLGADSSGAKVVATALMDTRSARTRARVAVVMLLSSTAFTSVATLTISPVTKPLAARARLTWSSTEDSAALKSPGAELVVIASISASTASRTAAVVNAVFVTTGLATLPGYAPTATKLVALSGNARTAWAAASFAAESCLPSSARLSST